MTEDDRAKITGRSVLLYDGVCALCNGTVRSVLKRDAAGFFRFAALQSDVARELLSVESTALDGVVLVTAALTPQQRIYRRSDAMIETLGLLERRNLSKVLGMVPRIVREAGYEVVARLRYRIFGRYEVCPLPPAEVRGRFVGFGAEAE
jgi:predicted DCC family thiol-disulfide oxidoreductase YuxK